MLTEQNKALVVQFYRAFDDRGGEIIAAGTPEQIAANFRSYTGEYLKQALRDHQSAPSDIKTEINS